MGRNVVGLMFPLLHSGWQVNQLHAPFDRSPPVNLEFGGGWINEDETRVYFLNSQKTIWSCHPVEEVGGGGGSGGREGGSVLKLSGVAAGEEGWIMYLSRRWEGARGTKGVCFPCLHWRDGCSLSFLLYRGVTQGDAWGDPQWRLCCRSLCLNTQLFLLKRCWRGSLPAASSPRRISGQLWMGSRCCGGESEAPVAAHNKGHCFPIPSWKQQEVGTAPPAGCRHASSTESPGRVCTWMLSSPFSSLHLPPICIELKRNSATHIPLSAGTATQPTCVA